MGELPAETRLGAIRLRVGDLERLHEFYETTIGLRTLSVADGVTSLGANGAALVELVADKDAPARPPRTTGLFHLALLVPTRADLARTLRRVGGSGGRLSGASDHLVSEALYLSDPDSCLQTLSQASSACKNTPGAAVSGAATRHLSWHANRSAGQL